jgi:DNA-binding XRE family transcriptional regulator
MVSKANTLSRTAVSEVSQRPKYVSFDETLNSDDELRAHLESEEGRVAIRELVLSHQIYKLRMLRKALGVSQVELAARLGVSQIRISQIENGKLERFELGTLLRYVEALGGSLELNVVLGAERLNLLEIEAD